MARLAMSGAELNYSSFSPEGSPTGLAQPSATSPRTGSFCWEAASGAGSPGWVSLGYTIATATTVYARVYINVANLPTSDVFIIGFGNGSTVDVGVKLRTGGQLQLWNAAQVGSDSSAISTGTWYRIELATDINGSGNWTGSELRIDGTSIASNSGVGPFGRSGSGLQFGWINNPGASKTIRFDDVAINDASGAANNTWPGVGEILLLLPTADGQRGSWTGGAGGTTNLWNAINNVPPIGTATETDLTQIESADSSGNNATDEYRGDMVMDAQGVSAGSTVAALMAVISHGEDVATGTKTGSFGFQANPATTYGTFTYGNDVGALGTWPATWSWGNTAIANEPSVTISTATKIAVRKTDTGTRVASVAFLGALVDTVPPGGTTVSVGAATALGSSPASVPVVLVSETAALALGSAPVAAPGKFAAAAVALAAGSTSAPVKQVSSVETAALALGLAPAPVKRVEVAETAALALGVAPAAVPLVASPATAALALGLTPDPTVVTGGGPVTVPVSASLGIGSTPAPSVLVAVPETASLAAGSSPAATPVVLVASSAALALGSSPAATPVVVVGKTAALALGVAPAATPVVVVGETAALALGSTPAALAAEVVQVVAALALGSAPVATPVSGSGGTVVVGAALALGTTPAPTVVVFSPATAALAAGVVPAATPVVLRAAAAALAAGLSSAPVERVVVLPAAALALGSTPAPTVFAGSGGTVIVGAALALGSAPAATPVVRALPAAALALGSAIASSSRSVSPAAAFALGSTPAPVRRLLVGVPPALALALTPDPVAFGGALVVPATVSVSDVTSGSLAQALDAATTILAAADAGTRAVWVVDPPAEDAAGESLSGVDVTVADVVP